MITHVGIGNFKGFSNYVDFGLSTITLLIGPNRSGKSSIGQALGVLKQSPKNEIIWNGDVVDLKDFDSVQNQSSDVGSVRIQFGGVTYASAQLEILLGVHRIEFGLTVDIVDNEIQQLRYDFGPHGRLQSGSFSFNENKQLPEVKTEHYSFSITQQPSIHYPIRKSGMSVPSDKHYSETQNHIEAENAFDEYLGIYAKHLQNFVYIPTMRGFDSTSYSLNNDNKIQSGKGTSKQAEQIASSIAYSRRKQKLLSNMIKMVFPDLDIAHNLSPDRVEIVSEDKHGSYNISNEGYGVNQLCILFYQFVSANDGATIFVEEPEIGLHPAAHMEIANALMKDILHNKKQLIITTHSEHILLSFLNAIRTKKLRPEQLYVYYFEKINGQNKITRLPVKENGSLEGGMKGFFEADMKYFESFLSKSEKK